MKSISKTALLSGILFGVFLFIYFTFFFGIKTGVLSGILSGIFFGVAMSAFSNYQKKKFQANQPVFENEKLLHEGAANHFKGIEGVGGWFYLTDISILFKSHSANIQKHDLSIPLQQIAEVNAYQTFKIIPNGFEIKTINGENEKFVVKNRNDWISRILKAKLKTACH